MKILTDDDGMRAALAWSAKGRGRTSPRPSVGSVLVRDGEILGGGHTQPGDGNPHAEVMALRAVREAGLSPAGATAYVTLEPCSHVGTTPPCTVALKEAGIVRVVTGVRDPNAAVDGRGFEFLRAAGIEVREAVLEIECARAQDHFLTHIFYSRPFVTVKLAATLDGRIAAADGSSQWISGESARAHVHALRADHDAVLCGIETVLQDNARLSVRGVETPKQPLRVVLDSHARLAEFDGEIFAQDAPLLVAVSSEAASDAREKLQSKGATTVEIDRTSHGLDLSHLLRELYAHGVYSVFVEGGARVATSFLRADLCDKVEWFSSPVLLGNGRSALEDFGVSTLGEAIRLRDVQTQTFENDVLISGYTRALPGTRDFQAPH
ncbi:MAG TPA: bifunctional diaminohydroxyphosphoribosylaminopyrimidine deaminase/5-amino-6-(5-phosphoribosylamino)uracil reductase RibD [Abditibacteriaceae bacterium]|jgi:diaminohydroxyphosphoribosylaminopyrimidine deaminase/5-amino-6-(5-phosphoribosylamino)uracil reductase